ncbi:MAG: 2-hydroxyacyl-CoA dehydratase [Desulfobacterales bacterium]|nr:2-hydroxyacyl-CoA dehydratase [Desulfobacterales bacterium]
MIEKIKALKGQGKPVIGCFPLYPPLELFHSLGLNPVVLWRLKGEGGQTGESDRHLQNYTCSVARHMTEFLLSEESGAFLDGIFMYNACDTLRNMPEIIEGGLETAGRSVPFFNIHIPMVPPAQTDGDEYLKNEVNRLIEELEACFDRKFDSVAFQNSVAQFKRLRMLYLQAEAAVANGGIGFREFAGVFRKAAGMPVEQQQGILEPLLSQYAENSKNQDKAGIILSGILPPPDAMVEAMESSGLRIVGNDIAALHRSYADMPQPGAEPAAYYRDFYFNHYPCPTLLYSGDRRVQALLERCQQTGAKGVVFIGEKFCEYEYFEFPYLEKKLGGQGVQTLLLELAVDDEDHSAAHGARIEAFAEMLSTS